MKMTWWRRTALAALLLIGLNGAAAQFTGSISGTALTVSGVTGTIAIGQLLQDATGALLSAGIALTSTGDSSLDGTYRVDSTPSPYFPLGAITAINTEALSIKSDGNFTNGTTSKIWYDASGGTHTFNPTQFTAFAQVAAQFVDAAFVNLAASLPSGKTWAAPSNTYTIA